MAWMKPLVKSGWLATDALIPLVLENGITDGSGGEPTPPPINWKTVTGSSPLALVNALAHEIKSLTQYGKCVQASTPTPSAPVDIVCNNGALKWDSVNQRVYADGTDEVLTVSGKNLFYADGSETGYINSSGDRTGSSASSGWRASDYIPVLPSTQYYFDPSSTSGSTAKHAYFTADKTFIDYISSGAGVFTTPSNCAFMRFSYRDTSTDIQLEYGDTATDYEPYVSPQTVTDIPMLLSAGYTTDEKDIISGAVTHKCGIKVFDGSEEWIDGSNGYITEAVQDQSGETYTPVCTHFRGTNTAPQKNSGTVRVYRTSGGTGRIYFAPNMTTYPTKEDFAAWLAAQYAAGTPVIVIYPLAEETTEQTTPHSLNSYEGTTVVDAQTSVDPVALSVEYASSEE